MFGAEESCYPPRKRKTDRMKNGPDAAPHCPFLLACLAAGACGPGTVRLRDDSIGRDARGAWGRPPDARFWSPDAGLQAALRCHGDPDPPYGYHNTLRDHPPRPLASGPADRACRPRPLPAPPERSGLNRFPFRPGRGWRLPSSEH